MTTLQAHLGRILPDALLDQARHAAQQLAANAGEDGDWLGEVQDEFLRLCEAGRARDGVALVTAALGFAQAPEEQFDLRNLQGMGLGAMIAAGDAPDLLEARTAAFDEALQSLPEDRQWDYAAAMCRAELARALQAEGVEKRDPQVLRRSAGEYAALLPAFEQGRWGEPLHAKAAEVAVRLAGTVESLARCGETADPLPYWLRGLRLTLDPVLRAADPNGRWQVPTNLVEGWIERLPAQANGARVCEAARTALIDLRIPAESSGYDWAQYYIAALGEAAGLDQGGTLAEIAEDAAPYDLEGEVAEARRALAAGEPGDEASMAKARFRLAYALHCLAEVLCDTAFLDEAIALYQQLIKPRTAGQDQREDMQQAMVGLNLAEAMASKGELAGDAALVRRAHSIAADARITFTLLGSVSDQAAAAESSAGILAILETLEAAAPGRG